MCWLAGRGWRTCARVCVSGFARSKANKTFPYNISSPVHMVDECFIKFFPFSLFLHRSHACVWLFGPEKKSERRQKRDWNCSRSRVSQAQPDCVWVGMMLWDSIYFRNGRRFSIVSLLGFEGLFLIEGEKFLERAKFPIYEKSRSCREEISPQKSRHITSST